MEITNVGEASLPAAGGPKTAGNQAGTGGFDLAMAAVMALLTPNPGGMPPAQNQDAGEPVFIKDNVLPPAESSSTQVAADLAPQQGLLPEAPTVTVEEARPTQPQMVQARGNELPPEPGRLMAGYPPVTEQADSAVKDAKTLNTTGETHLLFADAMKGSGSLPEKTAAVLPGTVQNTAEGDPAGAALHGPTAGKEKFSGVYTPGANGEAAAAKVNIAAETGPGSGTGVHKPEGEGGIVLSGKIEAGGTGSAGETKNESSGFHNSPGEALQPDQAQINAAGTQPNTKDLKGVTLPELKEVVAQEVKHIYDTRKGEPAQIQIELEPENLGKLTIRLSYNKGELNAHFYTGSEHVKEILESSMGQLRESLGRQELTLNQAFVFVGDENSGAAGGQAGFGSKQAGFFPDGYSGPNNPQPKGEPVDYHRRDPDSSGVNYLI